jgi:DNA repair photolyase
MTALSKSQLWKKRLGDWVVNPYVGCEHGCLHCYCPAMPGVKFRNGGRAQSEWGSYLLPKEGVVEALRRAWAKRLPPDQVTWLDQWLPKRGLQPACKRSV